MNQNKKKILIISPAAPFPLRSGADLAQHYFLEKRVEGVEYTFCTKVYDDHHYYKVIEYKKQNKDIHIILFDKRPAKFSLLSLKIFAAKIFNKLRDEPVASREKTYKPYNDYVDRDYVNFINTAITEHNIDVIQFEFLHDAQLAEFIVPQVTKVLIHHEIWYKAVQLRNEKSGLFSEKEMEKMKSQELKLLHNFDKIAVFNKDDQQELQKQLPDCHIVLSPYGIPDSEIVKKDSSDQFKTLLFIGSEIHLPNEQGLSWFIETFFIPNYDLYNYTLIIIGRWSHNYKDRYKKYSKIRFLGVVENLAPFYEDSIMLSPITSGSGLRTKILIALANRLPVLTTRFSAEGLFDEQNNKHLLFFDNEEELTNILTSPQLKNTLRIKAELGHAYFRDNFSKKILLNNRFSLYD